MAQHDIMYLPPVWVILVDDLHDVSLLEGDAQGLARDLVIAMTTVVKVSPYIFLREKKKCVIKLIHKL